ncbi:MAG: DMT family transporter [Betaproteobacteria bacterium]|nr:DMT family transporter [Betaproteobacteria bacterium]
MLAAVFFFALLDATSKRLALSFPVPFLAWARYLVHCLLMLIFIGPRLGRGLVATRRLGLQVLRALLLVGTTGFAMAALRIMPLAETTAVVFVTPLCVALLAGPWLGEKIGLSRWLAVGLGFVGVLLIARPGGELNLVGISYALACAACYTVYQLLTRQLSPTENTLTMLFYTALVGTLTMTLAAPWFGDIPAIHGWNWALIGAMGLFGGTGHFLLIAAFRHAPASTLSPFLYVQLLWATLLGWLVFGHLPDGLAAMGMGIIAVSGLWLALSQRRQTR